LTRPGLELAVVFNEAVREDDEWFDEPDDLERVAVALASIEAIEDPVEAAAVLVYRVTRAQASVKPTRARPCSWPAGCSIGTGSMGAPSSRRKTVGWRTS